MTSSRKISEEFVRFIKANSNKDEEELEIIRYGIEVILINFFKISILFITAKLLGILFYTFIAFVSFALLRTFASGVHANSSLKCVIANYIIFFSIVYLSKYCSLNKSSIEVVFLISLFLVVLYAPADTEERPLISKKLKESLKIKSVICLVFLAIISLLIKNNIDRSLIAYAVLEESIIITPIIYYIFGKSYRNYKKIEI